MLANKFATTTTYLCVKGWEKGRVDIRCLGPQKLTNASCTAYNYVPAITHRLTTRGYILVKGSIYYHMQSQAYPTSPYILCGIPHAAYM